MAALYFTWEGCPRRMGTSTATDSDQSGFGVSKTKVIGAGGPKTEEVPIEKGKIMGVGSDATWEYLTVLGFACRDEEGKYHGRWHAQFETHRAPENENNRLVSYFLNTVSDMTRSVEPICWPAPDAKALLMELGVGNLRNKSGSSHKNGSSGCPAYTFIGNNRNFIRARTTLSGVLKTNNEEADVDVTYITLRMPSSFVKGNGVDNYRSVLCTSDSARRGNNRNAENASITYNPDKPPMYVDNENILDVVVNTAGVKVWVTKIPGSDGSNRVNIWAKLPDTP